MKCPKCGRKVMMVSNNEGKKVAVCTVCDIKYKNNSHSIEEYLDSVNNSKNVKPIDSSKKIIKRGWD